MHFIKTNDNFIGYTLIMKTFCAKDSSVNPFNEERIKRLQQIACSSALKIIIFILFTNTKIGKNIPKQLIISDLTSNHSKMV
jgi:hypothetical protein